MTLKPVGGWSVERQVSLTKGKQVEAALREAGYDVTVIDVKKDIPALVEALTPKPDAVFNNLHGRGSFRAATGLIELENTANLAGGRVTPLAVMEEIWENARERKLPVHLDGARIFNAAAFLSTDVKTLTRGFDTVMFCLSKGLGAPAGCG